MKVKKIERASCILQNRNWHFSYTSKRFYAHSHIMDLEILDFIFFFVHRKNIFVFFTFIVFLYDVWVWKITNPLLYWLCPENLKYDFLNIVLPKLKNNRFINEQITVCIVSMTQTTEILYMVEFISFHALIRPDIKIFTDIIYFPPEGKSDAFTCCGQSILSV